jgi:hypothetical protein
LGEEFGLVAKVPIWRMTPVIVFAGKVITGDQVVKMSPRDQQMSLQVGKDLWQIPAHQNGKLVFDSGDYINHSCEPTCGMLDSTTVVTMRDIAVGEPLTIDYAMVNSGERVLYGDSFECGCGAPNCRQLVYAADYMVVGRKYLEFMAPYCREKYLDVLASKPSRGNESDADATEPSDLSASDDSF